MNFNLGPRIKKAFSSLRLYRFFFFLYPVLNCVHLGLSVQHYGVCPLSMGQWLCEFN